MRKKKGNGLGPRQKLSSFQIAMFSLAIRRLQPLEFLDNITNVCQMLLGCVTGSLDVVDESICVLAVLREQPVHEPLGVGRGCFAAHQHDIRNFQAPERDDGHHMPIVWMFRPSGD
jgi:hypothetical protein